ncbi:protein of unknown function [Methylocella tundrae]|uniref:HTH-like domain-containing protein n=3 Tax=Methylocella tundrae TaxID=227605 RepID=A0A4U8Z5A7_METTU|nr:protein of unknown function [Methylocella tundrae]
MMRPLALGCNVIPPGSKPAAMRAASTGAKLLFSAVSAADCGQLTVDIIELAEAYGSYGYRRITALLGHAGWAVNAIDNASV